MTKVVVFDWNGTLLSDTRACMEAGNEVLQRFGGKPVTLKEYRDTIHIPVIDFYVQHGFERDDVIKNSHDLSVVFHAFYEERAKHCRTRKGAKKLLQWLRRKKVKSVILSNHTVQGIINQLDRLGLQHLVDDVLANKVLDAPVSAKNKFERLKSYMKKMKYGKNDVIIVGDSIEEIEVGNELGITTVAITHGYYATPRLRALQPDYLIDGLLEIKKIF